MKKFLSLVLALIMATSLVTISAGAMDFTDAADVDYTEAVEVISALGIVSGNNGAFMPKENLTRQAAAKIVATIALGTTNAAKLPTGAAPFTDVPAGNHFAGYIAYLKDQGIVGGYGDGTFGPRAYLTGDAFLKQVLGVLGYKADMEGYSGNGWQVSVVIDAANAGLLEGLEDINTGANITREQAAQVMLNALEADMVTYNKSTSFELNGDGISISYGEVQNVPNTSGKHYSDAKDAVKNTMQLCEKNFSKLTKKVDGISDDFSRPAVKWVLDSEEICTAAEEPVLTYTNNPTYAVLYDALGLEENGKWQAYVDGLAWENAAGKTGPFTLNGGVAMTNSYLLGKQNAFEGASIEVYFDKDTKTATLIVINEYLAEVAAVNEPLDNTTKRTIDLKQVGTSGVNPYNANASTFAFGGYETEEFAKEDVVVFTFSKKLKNAGKTAAQSVKSMALAETTSGEFTRLGGETLVYIDGTGIRRAGATGQVYGGTQYGDRVTAYLNSYGNFLKVVAEKATNNYAVLLAAKADSTSNFGTKFVAQLLLTDGTLVEVETAENYGSNKLVGEFVTYKANSKGQYEFTDARSGDLNDAGLALNKIKVTNGASQISLNSTGATHAVNGETVFLVKELDADNNPVYNVYTGNKAVPSISSSDSSKYAFADAVLVEGSTKLAAYVYVDATQMTVDSSSASEALFFVYMNSGAKFSDKDGEWYNVVAVVDGVMSSVRYDFTHGSSNLSKFSLFEKYTINEDGYYVGGSAITGNYAKSATGVKYVEGTLIAGKDNSVANYYAVSEKALIAVVDYAKNLSLSSVDAIEEDANDVVTFFLDDETNEVIFAVIEKKA